MATPFDREIALDSSVECVYEVDTGEVRSAQDALHLVARTRARVDDGRRLRPAAEHIIDVVTPAAMSREIREALFPALGDDVDSLSVRGYPSWRDASAKLVPEPVRAPDDGWRHIASAYEAQSPLTATVTGTAWDGLHVDVGRRAFLPKDQIDLRVVEQLEPLIGARLEARVIQFDVPNESLVVSRRVILEERRDTLKAQTLSKIHEGASLRGRVETLVGYGAFIDLGGITGMLHIADMPDLGARMPAEVFSIGDEVTVSVVSYRPRMGLITLAIPARS